MEIVNANNVKILVQDVLLQAIRVANPALLIIISHLLQVVLPNAEHILGQINRIKYVSHVQVIAKFVLILPTVQSVIQHIISLLTAIPKLVF